MEPSEFDGHVQCTKRTFVLHSQLLQQCGIGGDLRSTGYTQRVVTPWHKKDERDVRVLQNVA